MQQITKTKTFRIAAIAALLVGLYAVVGFVAVPKILRSVLTEQVPKTIGATPTVGEIHFNPFFLKLKVNDFSLAAGGQKLVGFRELLVNLEFSSIWRRAYTFGHIDIAEPFVNAVVAKDGSLNLMKLKPKSSPKPAKQQPLPHVVVRSFNVSKGSLSYEDLSRSSAFATRLDPIDFQLLDFTTEADGGRFGMTGSSKLGERLAWHGHVSLQPIESDGELQVTGLHAHTIWEYLKDQVSFAVDSGDINLDATYKFSLANAVDLQLGMTQAAVAELTVRPKESEQNWITVPALKLSGSTLDLSKRQVHVDSLLLTGVKLVTWLEPDGSLNLGKLMQPKGQTPASTVAPVANGAPSAAPWQFDLHEFSLREAQISAEDRGAKPIVKVQLAPLSATVTGVSSDLTKPLSVVLDTQIDEHGALKVNGDVTPQPLTANLAVKVSAVELKTAQSYIAQHTSMTLLGGRLSGDVNVHYGTVVPTIKLTGNISVANLHTVDDALREDFVNWERLDLKGVSFQRGPDRLDIDQVLANKLYARVIIQPDATMNVKHVLAGPGATLVVPQADRASPLAVVTAPAPAIAPSAGLRKKPWLSQAAPSGSAQRAAVTGRAAPGTVAAGGAAAAPMPMSIKKIVLRGGEADFADLSLQPNFSIGLKDLEGTILGLSSRADSRAKVDIHGDVGEFSPVSISGEVNASSAALYTDLALNFSNIELSTFNPYSGKFAGYNITKGKLTTAFHYKVHGRKLDAQHHITIDQLEFGVKTASKDAVSLPVKLAVALLKDRNGVIDLDVPVAGTLDDPKFLLWPIIWKTLVNLLEKAVTAPFALLGRLVGGGADLQFIDFQPGVADLDAVGADKARSVAKVLNERPQLKIVVPIAYVSALDGPALIEAKYSEELREAQANKPVPKKRATDATPFDQWDPAAKLGVLLPLYAKAAAGEPKFPAEITQAKSKQEIAAAKVAYLERALHEKIKIADSDLAALGEQRAAAVQHAILTDTNVDPARVFLVANDKAKEQGGKVREELSLK